MYMKGNNTIYHVPRVPKNYSSWQSLVLILQNLWIEGCFEIKCLKELYILIYSTIHATLGKDS